jgi:hypothetical protein
LACSSCGQRARIAGLSAANPITIGDADDSAALPYRVAEQGAAGSLPVGTRVWITGSGVAAAIEGGLFADSPPMTQALDGNQPNTIYWVGTRGFTNLARAEAVSAKTGVEIRTESR